MVLDEVGSPRSFDLLSSRNFVGELSAEKRRREMMLGWRQGRRAWERGGRSTDELILARSRPTTRNVSFRFEEA